MYQLHKIVEQWQTPAGKTLWMLRYNWAKRNGLEQRS